MASLAPKLSSPVAGYPKLGHYMGLYSEYAIFRRFSSLNCQNLLYIQAELVHLEEKLRHFEAVDAVSPETPQSTYAKDWYWLSNSASEGNGDQIRCALEIRAKLKEYNEALIQQAQLKKLEEPRHNDLRLLQDWLERPTMGNLALIGEDRNIWGALDEPINPNLDLLTLKTGMTEDSFSRWFAVTLLRVFHRIMGHHFKKPQNPESGIVSYEERTVRRYTSHVTTIVASLLPVLATIGLRFAKGIAVQIVLISIFSFVFTSCMTVFTRATRGEIFIGTSTFAAVLVVFVSVNSA